MSVRRPPSSPQAMVRTARLARPRPLRRASAGAAREGRIARHRPLTLRWRRRPCGPRALELRPFRTSLSLALHWSVRFSHDGHRPASIGASRVTPAPTANPATMAPAAHLQPAVPLGPRPQRRPPAAAPLASTISLPWKAPGPRGSAPLGGVERRLTRRAGRALTVTGPAAAIGGDRRALPMIHRRRQGAATISGSRPRDPAPSRIELVWRTSAAAKATAAAAAMPAAGLHPPDSAGQRAPLHTATVLPTARAATTSQAPGTLDPRIAERLADDVIRRVERHVRIERERRGLL